MKYVVIILAFIIVACALSTDAWHLNPFKKRAKNLSAAKADKENYRNARNSHISATNKVRT